MKDINDLRQELITAFEWVKADPRRANQVKEMTNAAGKIISSIGIQLEYASMRREEPDIPFLGKTSGKPIPSKTKLINA